MLRKIAVVSSRVVHGRLLIKRIPFENQRVVGGIFHDSGFEHAKRQGGRKMKTWRALSITFFLIAGCASGSYAGNQGAPGPGEAQAVPVITNSFAAREIVPRYTWKVYLNAQDPNGDMRRIACTIDQPGLGTYPVSFTEIPGAYQQTLSGYIYLNTGRTPNLDFININLSVQIQDRNGQYSKPATFPLSIYRGSAPQPPPPPGIFQETDLGPIKIHLRTLKR